MRIAIFGSWREAHSEWPKRATFEEFREAARELGRALAHLGQRVILGGETDEAVDVYVAQGIVEVAGTNRRSPPLIEVMQRSDDSQVYRELAKLHPHLFEFHCQKRGWWEGAHMISIKAADAVIVMCGGRGTFVVGLAALVCGKRVVPIGSFGGAGERLLKEAESLVPSSSVPFKKLNGPWTEHLLEIVVEASGARARPRLLLVHGRSRDWLDLKDWLHEQEPSVEPIVMSQQFGGGETLPQKLQRLGSRVDGAIALATADDLGRLAGGRRPSQARARQNVWIEVGWFWGRLGLDRVMLLVSGDIEVPSDLQGLEHYTYDESPRERSDDLRAFLAQLRA